MKINASLLKIASTCRAINDIRYYLSGVLVEPRKEGGAYIVASNGHMLIACIDTAAEVSDAVLINPSKELVRAIPKIYPGGDETGKCVALVDFAGKPALILTDGNGAHLHAQVNDAVIDAPSKFPKWRNVLPDFSKLKQGMNATVFPDYLSAPFGAFSKSSFGCESEFWQVPPSDGEPAGVVAHRINGRSDVLHLVMPRRENKNPELWLSLWKDQKEVSV